VSIGTKRNETTFTTSSKDMFVKFSVISILSPLPARANVTCRLGAVVYAG
ncbi:unnamed protein product, partial [Tilletia laevis]